MNIISSPSKLSVSWYHGLTPSTGVSTSYPKYIRRITLAASLSPATAIRLNVFHSLISTGPQYIYFLSQWHSRHDEIYIFTPITFLDVSVSLLNGKIVTVLFTKPTDKLQYLLHSSCHPIHTKRAVPFSLALRLRRICSTNETFTLRTDELIDYIFTNVAVTAISFNGKYNELTISHGQKHLRPMTPPHWTNQNVFPSLSLTTQPYVPLIHYSQTLSNPYFISPLL